ncbi:MAG: hypothetical protein ABSD21_11515 [Rhizomicrobium sp.]|jgi:hypothetical protein
MHMFLKGAAIALALAGTALATTGTTSAAGIYFGSGGHNGRSSGIISIGFGDVAFGYRDGYWDSGHRWHHWRHNRDYRDYRGQNGSNYHDWNHDRDSNNGWQR